MKTNRILKLGIEVPRYFKYYANPSIIEKKIKDHYSDKCNIYAQMMFTLAEYFVLYKRKFDRAKFFACFDEDAVIHGIPIAGVLKLVNHTVVDIGVKPKFINKMVTEAVDFSYPYSLASFTFVIPKPQYKPHIFGIFQTLSLWVWLTVLLVFIMMIIFSYITSKSRYSFSYVVLHVFAVLMRQTSIVTPSSFAEKILIHAWIIGAMFLCLSYDSVFLSFLTFPPLNKIKHLSDLAMAVENGDYRCIGGHYPSHGIAMQYLMSENKYVRIIGEDILKHIKLSEGIPQENFFRYSKKQNVALIWDWIAVDWLAGKYFVSEDHFFESMGAMLVRKNFCCKKLLDEFVHRMMASGMWFKHLRVSNFILSLPLNLNSSEEYDSKRQLTLTDVAPAFIFLSCGYFISILCLIAEILSHRKKNLSYFTKRKRRIIEPCNDVSV